MKKKILSALLALCMALSLLPSAAYATNISGACGTNGANLQWVLDTNTMVLSIIGSGSMPDYYGGSPWQEYAEEIKKVILSEDVKNIGAQAFLGCTALESVNFPSNLTSIGYSAFSNCYSLTDINIPDTVTSVGDMAFINCTGLASVKVPSRVVSNGKDVFSGCTSLSSITIPDGTTAIGSGMFNGCSSLTSVLIPNGVTSIRSYAFSGCSNLAAVSFPASLESIEDQAFSGCTSLSHVNFPDGLKSIGLYAFLNCTGLNQVIIPDTVVDMGKTININYSNEAVFNGCTGLTSAGPIGGEYSIQYGWTGKIPEYAFYGCTSLTSVELPDSMSEIGDHAFQGCTKLTKITLLKNISAIGEDTFTDCGQLTIYCYQYSYAHQYAIAHNIPFVLLDGEPDQPDSAQILRLSPQPGAENVSYDPENPPVFEIIFDRPITSIETSADTFSIYRASDNELLYSSRTPADFQFYGTTLTVTSDIQLEPATEYYVTMIENAIRFDDGSVNPAVEKGKWDFITEYFSTVDNVRMGNYGSPKTTVIATAWNDKWFTEPATAYNHDLATTAAVLSGAAYVNDASGETGSGSIVATLQNFGFEEIQPVNYPVQDIGKVAFCLAVKAISNDKETGPRYLISIVVKGTDLNNFNELTTDLLATPNQHVGFTWATEDLMRQLGYYRDRLIACGYNLNGSNTEFFITGHSLGAAVANLTVSFLRRSQWTDYLAYTYTFATPTVSELPVQLKIEGVFNILNPDDWVTKIPPWLSSRFGLNLKLPSKSNYGIGYDDLYKRMDSRFSALTGENYFLGAKSGTQLADSLNSESIKDTPPGNIEQIMQSHSVSLYYSWLSTCTPSELYKNNSTFKRINIACPVDVYVYDESNNIVASVINEQIDVNILAASVEDGTKTIDLPSDQEYSVKIVAREEGAVNYTVNELSTETTGDSVLRTVEFHDINIAANDILTGEVNDILYTEAENYALTKNGDTIIRADYDSKGNPPVPNTFTINFDANGGNVDLIALITNSDGKLTNLPMAVRNGYTFNGWFTASSGGDKITTDTVFDSNATVYAQWTYVGTSNPTTPSTPSNPGGWYPGSYNSPTTSYNVSVPSVTGGTVSVRPTSAAAGSTVTITATPDTGYELAALSVTDASGKSLELTNKGDGKYSFKMPNGKVSLAAEFRLASGEVPWDNPFADVSPSAWYYDAVKFVNQNGLMNGAGNGLFVPDAYLSRAMLAEILYNKEGRPAMPDGVVTFPDVSLNGWYTNAVSWAYGRGIIKGYDNGLFGPGDDITREQLAVMLYRYAGSPVPPNLQLNFIDAHKVSSWAQDAMCWAVNEGVLSGKGNGILDPTGKATRAEAAQMLKNYLDK